MMVCKTMLLEKAPVKAKTITARPPPADTSQSQKKIFLWQKTFSMAPFSHRKCSSYSQSETWPFKRYLKSSKLADVSEHLVIAKIPPPHPHWRKIVWCWNKGCFQVAHPFFSAKKKTAADQTGATIPQNEMCCWVAENSEKQQRLQCDCERGVWAMQSQCVDCWLAGVRSWLLTTSVPVSWPPIPTNFTRYRRHFAVTTFSLSCLAIEHNYLVAFFLPSASHNLTINNAAIPMCGRFLHINHR